MELAGNYAGFEPYGENELDQSQGDHLQQGQSQALVGFNRCPKSYIRVDKKILASQKKHKKKMRSLP